MRRVVFERQGGPDVLTVVDAPDPVPGPGEVLVAVDTAGVNFTDVYQRGGAYSVPLPFTPGMEGAGHVLRVGPDVSTVAEGDRVAWFGGNGAYATHCLVPAQRLLPLPDGLSLPAAVATLVQGLTAHLLVTDVVPADGSTTCLVHAAAGGVGHLLCQQAVARGATVIGTVSSAEKAAVAREAGAHHVIDYRREDVAARVMELTDGRGVDVVYDGVGRDTVDADVASLRPRGTLVLYGQSSGPVTSIDPQVLNARGSLRFTKPSLTHYDTTRDHLIARAGAVWGAVADGSLRPRVDHTYPLDGARDAHAALEARTVAGKVLLSP